jgi:cytochrome c biogenesis protein CcdA
MELLLASFLAGLLTVLAPCVLTLLPVIIGGSLQTQSKTRPLVIALSLGVSVILFTLLLKASTLLIDIPDTFWKIISGGVIIFLSLTMLFPDAWSKLAFKLKLYKSEEFLSKTASGNKNAIVLGAALGPVFSTCSPTYLYIVATVLPAGFLVGFTNLVAYALGMMLLLLLIGYGGQAVVKKLKFAANPNGWFKKAIAILLLLVGIMIITGLDKDLESFILDRGYLGPIEIENSLLENAR